jgi:hypothetical protein
VINLFGGIAISKEKLIKPLAELNVKSIEVLNFKAKIGFGFTFIAKDFMIELEDFNIKIGEFSMKRGFFNESITELTLKDAEITIIAEEDETIQVSLNRLKSLLFGGKMQEKLIEKITAQNVSLNIIRRKSGTTQSIKNFTGEIIDMVDVLNVKGKFDFGVNNYEIEGFVRLEDGSFEVKIDGINLVFKLQMAENKGKVSFSINNITSFLNDITQSILILVRLMAQKIHFILRVF